MASIEEREKLARQEIRLRDLKIAAIDQRIERFKAMKVPADTLKTLALSRRANVNNRQGWLDYIKRGCVSG